MKLSKWMCVSAFLAFAPSGFCQSSLYEAMWDGPKAVRKAIHAGANVNALINNDRTPLMLSAGICDARIAQELISAGADLSVQNKDGRTAAMYWAASGCNDKTVLQVLSSFQGDVVNIQDKGGNTALMYALECPNPLPRVKELVQNGAKLDIFNQEGENAVILAAKGNSELARQIARSSRELDEALYIAAYAHNLPAVKGLLRAGANPNWRLSEEDAMLLLERSLGPKNEGVYGPQNALLAAASAARWAEDNGDLVVREIYNAGGTQGAEVAFLASVYYHRLDALEELLKYNVNIYESFGFYRNAWWAASRQRRLRAHSNYLEERLRVGKIVSLLLDAGLPVDQRQSDSQGDTPLMLFAAWDSECFSTKAVHVLLKGGANKNKRNNEGKTAYDMAECPEYKHMLKPDDAGQTSAKRKSGGRSPVRSSGARRR
ncbi:MAG: ankyrin repeat domain-containing protein [Candidatus Avelusimicrobium sp.]|uniref:ankyrin repeat domain-containing protein n=1 Tax=Candidatus Avelusimicrobium sp. TaxID=3048833 RepID=UPI003F113101